MANHILLDHNVVIIAIIDLYIVGTEVDTECVVCHCRFPFLYHLNNFCSLKLVYLLSPIIMWSNSGISICSPAPATLSVSSLSALLGVGSPLGWLCTRMIFTALSFNASKNISLERSEPCSHSRPTAFSPGSTVPWHPGRADTHILYPYVAASP